MGPSRSCCNGTISALQPENLFNDPRIYLIYMYEEDLALNNLYWLICHEIQQNKIIYFIYM